MPDMKKLRGRLVTSNDIVSDLIRLKTTGKYSHIEFFTEDGQTLGARSKGGVRVRPANYATFSLVWNFEIDVPAEQYDKTMAFARKQIGKPYDFTAIVGIEFNRDWREDDSWFCSELAAASLEAGEVIAKLSDDINHVTPEECLLILSSMPNVRHIP